MMRVAIIGLNYPPEPTGVAPYTGSAAEALAARGHGVRVITGFPHYPQWRVAPGYTGLTMRHWFGSVHVTRLRHPVPPRAGMAHRIGMELVFGLRAVLSRWHRPDAVLAVSPALLATLLVVVRARLTRTPIVVWVQDIYTLGAAETGRPAHLARFLRRVEGYTFRSATRVLVIHPRFRRYLSQSLGVSESRIDVVRNWTHVNPAPARSERTRRRWGWREAETVVLHAGNMGAKQGLESVVTASRLAAERGLALRFVLLGDGNRRRELEASGPNPCLQFLDPLPDGEFAETLASADLLLVNELPGMTEMSVPSKLTTYFATGLPVLGAVDASSVTADEIDLSGGGLRVSAGDPEALLDGALRLAADPGLRAALGAAGLRYRQDWLSADRSIEGILSSISTARGSQRGDVHVAEAGPGL